MVRKDGVPGASCSCMHVALQDGPCCSMGSSSTKLKKYAPPACPLSQVAEYHRRLEAAMTKGGGSSSSEAAAAAVKPMKVR